jgi:hypothetical protein
MENKKILIIVSIVILFMAFLFTCGDKEKDISSSDVLSQNNDEIITDISEEQKFVEPLPIEPLQKINKFILPASAGFRAVSAINEKSFWGSKKDFRTPPGLKDIVNLIRKRQFIEAEDRLMIVEKNADYETLGWLIYFKAEIYFNAGDLAFAKVFYEEHLKRFPGHVLETNVRNALKYISRRHNL